MVLFSLFLVICIFFTLLKCILQRENGRYIRYLKICFIFYVILFAGLRYGFTWDYFSYKEIYDQFYIDDLFSFEEYLKLDFMFIWLVYFLKNILLLDYQSMFFIYSLLIYIILFRGYENFNIKESIYYFFFFIIINRLFFQSLSYMRQFLAVAIVFYGFKYVYKKSLKKYILIIILASLCHFSAFIMLPIYFISNLRIKKGAYFFALFLSFIICIFLPLILDNLTSIVFLLENSEIHMLLRVAHYFELEGNRISLSVVFDTLLALMIIVFVHRENNSEKMNCMVNMSLMSICIFIMFSSIEELVRINAYFNIFIPISIVSLANRIKKAERMIFYFSISAYYIAVLFNSINQYETLYNFRIDQILW